VPRLKTSAILAISLRVSSISVSKHHQPSINTISGDWKRSEDHGVHRERCSPRRFDSRTMGYVNPNGDSILADRRRGSPAHLAAAKEELENAWSSKQNIKVNTAVSGSSEDPTVTTTVNDGGSEELVMVVAGGMTSQLTYDGVDVCASRVAWEVRMDVLWGSSGSHTFQGGSADGAA